MGLRVSLFNCPWLCSVYTYRLPFLIPRPGALPFSLAWVKPHGGTMLALEGWGKNLALLSRRLLMVILQRAKGFQRDCECGLVDEECSHSHTKSTQSLPHDPMHGPSSLPQKETGQDLTIGACQPLSLLSPGATQNDWRHSRPPPTNCTALSQPLPPGERHTRPGQSSLASAWLCKARHQPSSWNIYIYTGRAQIHF